MDVEIKRQEAISEARNTIASSKQGFEKRQFAKFWFSKDRRQLLDSWKSFSDSQSKLYETCSKTLENKSMESYVSHAENMASDSYPNLESLLGLKLCYGLLAVSGGLEQIAKTSSTSLRKKQMNTDKLEFDSYCGIFFNHKNLERLEDRSQYKKFCRFLSNKSVNAARRDYYRPESEPRQFNEIVNQKINKLKNR
jgi:RNA processing factor Prp31